MKIIRRLLLIVVLLLVPFEQCKAFTEEADDLSMNDQMTHLSINEYDFCTDVRKMSFIDAAEMYGISVEEYNVIGTIETEILELTKQSDADLYARGMNDLQISIVREYDGSRLEDNQQLRAVMATLSMTLSKVSCTSSYASVKASWAWSSQPLIMSVDYYETVPCRWKAYNSSGARVAAGYSSSGSYCYVKYYYGSTLHTTQSKSITVGNASTYVYCPFHSAIIDGGDTCWAKSGYMVVKITGSNINNVDFGFGYNHGISSTIPTVTLDSVLGFNYSNGYEMAEKSISISI